MIILLYRPDAESAFAKYDSSCMVNIIGGRVYIRAVSGDQFTYDLVKKCAPVWTDDTKVVSEIMVKLIVNPIEVLA